jgi:two-component system alkaline phosphatase synthesis response regulator PhoP
MVAGALELGAAGYMEMPASKADLGARVREMLAWRSPEEGRYVTVGAVTLDVERRALVRPRAALTPCEFEILRWLLTPPGRTFTRRQLLATDRAAFPPRAADRLVDRQVENLRRKMGDVGELVERAGSVGWRFAAGKAAPAEVEFRLTNATYEA